MSVINKNNNARAPIKSQRSRYQVGQSNISCMNKCYNKSNGDKYQLR